MSRRGQPFTSFVHYIIISLRRSAQEGLLRAYFGFLFIHSKTTSALEIHYALQQSPPPPITRITTLAASCPQVNSPQLPRRRFLLPSCQPSTFQYQIHMKSRKSALHRLALALSRQFGQQHDIVSMDDLQRRLKTRLMYTYATRATSLTGRYARNTHIHLNMRHKLRTIACIYSLPTYFYLYLVIFVEPASSLDIQEECDDHATYPVSL